jgi:hypothetical protein
VAYGVDLISLSDAYLVKPNAFADWVAMVDTLNVSLLKAAKRWRVSRLSLPLVERLEALYRRRRAVWNRLCVPKRRRFRHLDSRVSASKNRRVWASTWR